MEKKDLRIVFMGTPEFAVESLKRLVEGEYNVVAVVTQPDKPVGRHGSVLRASAVKEYAISKGLPVLQPVKMRDELFLKALSDYDADIQVVVAYRMLPDVVWAMPRFGTFNVHASLLPHYRGAAPINWAVINGETVTGVTTFFLDHEIDTGRIILQRTFGIPEDADVEYVYDGLMKLGADICIETIDRVLAMNGNVQSHPQVETVGLKPAPKIFKETCRIEWKQPAKKIHDFVRGLSPVPGAWTAVSSDNRQDLTVKIFKTVLTHQPAYRNEGSLKIEKGRLFVAATDEWIEIVELQMSGKKRMLSKDFINGCKTVDNWTFR